jgi:DNA processing protein
VEGGGVSFACDRCLRRGALIGFLSPYIQAAIARPDRRTPSLLTLPEHQMIAAVGESARGAARRLLDGFDPAAARVLLQRADCDALCRHSPRYPPLLAQLHDPPNPLYVRGGIERMVALAAEPCVAMVGGRRPSSYARGVAQRMGRGLASAGITVVSGLALGIDAESHRGALEGGGAPIAVLARSPELPYPRRHGELYRRVLERGVVVSELPPGTPARKWGFPARNRIMVGFSTVVVVVEAREASGSLITAAFAAETDRELAAVPGQVDARVAAGSNALLHEGAAFVRGAEDVLDLIFGVGQGPRPRAAKVELEPHLRAVLDGVEVGDEPAHVCDRSGLSPGEVRAALGRLEAMGLVRRDSFGGYERSDPAVAAT